jgi:hypothetical protein
LYDLMSISVSFSFFISLTFPLFLVSSNPSLNDLSFS